MTNNTKIAVAVAVLAIALIVYRKNFASRDDDHGPARTLRAAAPSRNPFRKKDGELLRQASRDQRLGFKLAGYTVDAKGHSFMKITVKATPICSHGDYDAMVKAVGESGRLLVSLEPFGKGKASGSTAVHRDLAVRDIVRGITFDLPVNPNKPGVYGLYLCSDASQQGGCGKKSAANINKILGSRARGDDAIYYFQFTILKPKASMVYGGRPDHMGDMREDLEDQGIDRANLRADLSEAAEMMRRVQSVASRTIPIGPNMAIALPIARLDEPFCSNAARH